MIEFKDLIEDLKLNCLSISTDGDNGVDNYHIEMFDQLGEIFNEDYDMIAVPLLGHPSVDLFHVLKSQRARFYRQNMALSPESPIVNSSIIQQIVERSACFSKMDQVIRYRDDYAIDFFLLHHFLMSFPKKKSLYLDIICLHSFYGRFQ